jgi:hypothetical protein
MLFSSKVHSKIKKPEQKKNIIDFFTIVFSSHSGCNLIGPHLVPLQCAFLNKLNFLPNVEFASTYAFL